MEESSRLVRLLLVEDNRDHAYLIHRCLKKSGALLSFRHVSSGEQAIFFLRQSGIYQKEERPDLIFLDLKMPGIDGHDVLKLIKEDEQLKTIPVVVFTTSTLASDKEKARGNHANSFVEKPNSVSEFMDIIQRMCQYWTGVDIGMDKTLKDLLAPEIDHSEDSQDPQDFQDPEDSQDTKAK